MRTIDARLEDVEELSQLARALYDLECAINQFKLFADGVRDMWFKKHHMTGERAQEWAVASVVFGWELEFGCTVLDIVNLSPKPRSRRPASTTTDNYVIGLTRSSLSQDPPLSPDYCTIMSKNSTLPDIALLTSIVCE
jgi:hypothetical protein